MRQARQESRSGPSSCPAVRECQSLPTSLLLAPDIGNYLHGPQSTRGGFLPIFWDAPDSYMHASTDIGEVVDWIRSKFSVTKDGNKNLAVLHNRNKMVNAFAATEWVSWLRWRCSLTQCHFLCGYDSLSGFACANQSGVSQWRTRKKFPSAHPTGAECPKGLMGLRISLRRNALASSLLRSPPACLLVIPTPNDKSFAGNSCNG